jgi:hypothetical protein
MRIKQKPVKPSRRTVEQVLQLYEGITVQHFIDFVNEHGANPSDVKLMVHYYYDDHDTLWLVYNRQETDTEYGARLNQYKTRLAKWSKWYQENKEAVEAERAARASKKKVPKAISDLQTQKVWLERQLKTVQDKLNKAS